MSKIEWTGQTWNPIVGCSIVSPGCTHCYAMRMAARIERMSPGAAHYKGLTKPSKAGPVWTGKVALAPEKTLLEPLRTKMPTTWFVNSMSDLFHEDVSDEWIDRVFAVMALCPQHTFQVLTKRSARMRAYVVALEQRRATGETMFAPDVIGHVEGLAAIARRGWPLPNVWLGISSERQQEADARIPDLLATPAAVRFVSAEPLLAPVDFTFVGDAKGSDGEFRYDALTGRALPWGGVIAGTGVWSTNADKVRPCPRLDWIIVGGESGPNARMMDPDWARSIRDQCRESGVHLALAIHGHKAGPDGITTADIQRLTGWTKTTVRQALHELKSRGVVTSRSVACSYCSIWLDGTDCHKSCNSRKSAKPLLLWLMEIGGRNAS